MTEFSNQDLSGATFTGVDLRGATFRAVDLSGVRMNGVELVDVRIDGELDGLVVNGVDVAPLVEAELDRRDPDRPLMRPADPAGFRRAWDVVESRWDQTVARARALEAGDRALLHASVGGEWSFIETLRHLCYATAAWVHRGLLGDPAPWHPLDLPWDEAPEMPGVPRDRTARPTLEEVLALRRERMATVREVVEALSAQRLAGETVPGGGSAGWPPPEPLPYATCLLIVLNEEYQHRRYAERDLATLESGCDPRRAGVVRPGEQPVADLGEAGDSTTPPVSEEDT